VGYPPLIDGWARESQKTKVKCRGQECPFHERCRETIWDVPLLLKVKRLFMDVHAAAVCTNGHLGLRDTEAASGDGGEFGLAAHLGGDAAEDV